MPAVLAIAKNGSEGRARRPRPPYSVGNASCVPVLMEMAAGADEELSKAAVEALAGMSGKDVDAALAEPLAAGFRARAACLSNWPAGGGSPPPPAP